MGVQISRILHAGYILRSGKTEIVFDPIFETPFSRNCYAFPSAEFSLEGIRHWRPSAIFISHYHDDHCSFDSLDLLDRETPIYMYCLHEEIFGWLRQLGFKNVSALRLNQTVEVGDFSVTTLRALDRDVDALFQIKVQDVQILNVVDSWIDDEVMDYLKRSGPWDVVLWPFQTMNELEVIAPARYPRTVPTVPPEWLAQLRCLNPRIVVPSSCQFIHETWSWYRYAYFPISYGFFAQEVQGILPSSEIRRLNPGESFTVSKDQCVPALPVSWIRPVGAQDLDYDFDVYRAPMATSEIVKYLPSLSARQAAEVQIYCREGLAQKFAALNVVEGYFSKPRLWQLSIYGSQGECLDYFYFIQGKEMRRVEGSHLLPDWSTELPEFKLYSALTTGESLSSLYLRVNERKFTEDVEASLLEADILEDPLLKCLFNQDFGSYQKAQLDRLLCRDH